MATIAILGAGSVGQALGRRLVSIGRSARFGVREPKKAEATLAAERLSIPVMLPAEAATQADIVFLAVPATAAIKAVEDAGGLAQKTLVDCTNPLTWKDGPIWTPPPEGSVTQALAVAFPDLILVKGFNHFGAEIMAQPNLTGGPADAFFAGDDKDAKRRVMELATEMGFGAHDVGPLRNAAVLENLAVLWIQLATAGGLGRQFAFRAESNR
jgi:8-hydroxy-5-deazaflavin:NADPH oxidoreductase